MVVKRIVAGNLLMLAMALLVTSCAMVPRGTTQIDKPFSIVLLPDTQFYSEKFPETYIVQTRWIKESAEALSTKFVIHVGDVVQNPQSETEWKVADRAHKVLDGHVPYSVLPGNHDGAPGKLSLYNKYFGPARFADQPWYGGSISPTNNGVNFCRFSAGGQQWMVLSLTYDPTESELAWARKTAAAHPDDTIILATHAYLLRTGKPGPRGRLIWEQLVRQSPNIRMVVSGHISAVAHSIAVNDSGADVHQILCDYQGGPNGGNGWLQTMRFDPVTGKVHVEAYSPLLDQYNKEPKHTYTLDLGVPGEKGKHLFILSGQSNMVGLKHEASFNPAVIKALGKDRVLVVKDAHSGQSIRSWCKNNHEFPPATTGRIPKVKGELYVPLINKVHAAIKEETIQTITFVWMQGESDLNNTAYDLYLKELLQQLQDDLQFKDINLVIGRISDSGLDVQKRLEGKKYIRRTQAEFATSYPHGVWVDTDDLNDREQDGKIIHDLHYTPAGYQTLGERFAQAAIDLIKAK